MSIGEISERKERPAYVRFERVAVEDKPASASAGHYVAKDVDYALVTPPYSKDVFKIKVSDWWVNLRQDIHNNRIPVEWVEKYEEMYKRWKAGQEIPLEGTPIKGWGVISPAQQETLIGIGIRTVEDLAAVNDEGVRRIGMGALDLKNKAKGWLSQLNDKGPLTQEVASVKSENAVLKSSVEALSKQVESLMNQLRVNVVSTQGVVAPIHGGPERISAADILDDGQAQEVEQGVEREVEVKTRGIVPDEKDFREAYMKKFGKPPHHRMKPETILAALKG